MDFKSTNEEGVGEVMAAPKAEVESMKDVDKSLVSLKVPRRFAKRLESVEWREFRLKTRLMPSGYRITLAFVAVGNRIIFGASACSPGDFFVKSSAFNRAIGRARQTAFLVLTASQGTGSTSLLFDRKARLRRDVVYYSADPSNREELLAYAKSKAVSLYDLVASNAERNSVLFDCSILQRQHGNRFKITVSDAK